MKFLRSLSPLVFVCAAACVTFRATIDDHLAPSVVRVLREPESLDLVTLAPEVIEVRAPELRAVPAEHNFHGFEIREHVSLVAREVRHELVALVFEGILAGNATDAGDFRPHVGLRAVREGQVVDLVIDFESGLIDVTGPVKSARVRTSPSVQARIEALYRANGLTLREP